MGFKFNPFSGNFDQTGSGGGGGTQYIDGEVQNFSALPQTVGSPAVDSAYLVREAEGTWLLNRKPAGIYIRTANTGTRASDWTYAGEFPDVFNDANLVVYNNTDSTKNVKFDASAIATGTTRTLTVPDASGTIQLTGHAASHASAGSDPLAPSDIGAQSVFQNISVTASSDTTLTASRAGRYNILNFTGTALNITLPTTNLMAGDVAIVSSPVMTGGGSLVIRRLNADASYTTLATITKSVGNNGETFRFYTVGTASQDWRVDIVANHGSTHASNGSDPLSLAASQITSGTLAYARGGLAADVAAYNGLVKISGGSTSAVTVTSAGEALLDDADAAAQRTTLGLGTAATAATGDFAAASHTHELTALAATGATNGHVLTANGSGGVTFAAASGGVSAVNSTLADILSVSGSDLVADDLGADKLYGWDDSAGKAIGFTVSTGLETDGTNLKAKITSDPTGVSGADAITNIMSLTQAEYDAIGSPNASTLYIITDP